MHTEKPDFLHRTIDGHVAWRLKSRVDVLSLSNDALAHLTGIRADTVAEFLAGAVRIPAAALYALAVALDVNVYYFFDGVVE